MAVVIVAFVIVLVVAIVVVIFVLMNIVVSWPAEQKLYGRSDGPTNGHSLF